MHRFDRPRYFVLGLIVMACAWAMPGHAQQPPIEGTWSVVARTVRPAGQQVDIGMEARNRLLNSQTLYASERAALTPATVGKLATGVLRRANGAYATYAVLKSVMDAAGWGINELRNQVVVPATPRQEIAKGSQMYCVFAGSPQVRRCTVTEQGAVSICNAFFVPDPAWGWKSCVPRGDWGTGDGNFVNAVTTSDAVIRGPRFQRYTATVIEVDWGTGSAEAIVTDEQIFDLLKSTRPDLFAELLKDANGNVIVTPEVAEALNRFRAAVEAATGTVIDPIVSDPGAVEEGEGDATPSAWPKFCAWATVVCEFIEDFKKQPDTENLPLPEREAIIEEQHWSSGLASDGACPAPETVDFTLMDGSYSFAFEYTPICQLATKMRPVLLTIAALLAVFIVAGLRKAGGAS